MKLITLLATMSIFTGTCSAMIKRTTQDYEAAIAARAIRRTEFLAAEEIKKEARKKKYQSKIQTREHKIARARRAVDRAKKALAKNKEHKALLEKRYQNALKALYDEQDPILFSETDVEDSEQEEDDDDTSVIVLSSTTPQDSQAIGLAAASSDSSMNEPHFHGIRAAHYQFVSMWSRMNNEEKMHWLKNITPEDLTLVKRYDADWYNEFVVEV